MPTWVKDVVGIGLILMAAYGGVTIIQRRKIIDWNNELHLVAFGLLAATSGSGLIFGVLVLLGILPMNN